MRAAVASRVWRVSLVMLAIFTEPLRMMTRFFVHCSSTTHRHCSPPYLVDLANPASDCGTIFVHDVGQHARPCRVVAQGSLFDWIAPWRKDSAFQSFAHLVKFSGNIQVSFVVSLGVWPPWWMTESATPPSKCYPTGFTHCPLAVCGQVSPERSLSWGCQQALCCRSRGPCSWSSGVST